MLYLSSFLSFNFSDQGVPNIAKKIIMLILLLVLAIFPSSLLSIYCPVNVGYKLKCMLLITTATQLKQFTVPGPIKAN